MEKPKDGKSHNREEQNGAAKKPGEVGQKSEKEGGMTDNAKKGEGQNQQVQGSRTDEVDEENEREKLEDFEAITQLLDELLEISEAEGQLPDNPINQGTEHEENRVVEGYEIPDQSQNNVGIPQADGLLPDNPVAQPQQHEGIENGLMYEDRNRGYTGHYTDLDDLFPEFIDDEEVQGPELLPVEDASVGASRIVYSGFVFIDQEYEEPRALPSSSNEYMNDMIQRLIRTGIQERAGRGLWESRDSRERHLESSGSTDNSRSSSPRGRSPPLPCSTDSDSEDGNQTGQ